MGSFTKMEFRGVYLAYYSGNPTNNEQNPTIASMPTYTIGSGSVFQADGTTTSEFSGSPGQDYNSTYQYFTYDIPLAPGTNYATVIYNASWEITNAYPSTFLH